MSQFGGNGGYWSGPGNVRLGQAYGPAPGAGPTTVQPAPAATTPAADLPSQAPPIPVPATAPAPSGIPKQTQMLIGGALALLSFAGVVFLHD